jgi:hypothetical protein
MNHLFLFQTDLVLASGESLVALDFRLIRQQLTNLVEPMRLHVIASRQKLD